MRRAWACRSWWPSPSRPLPFRTMAAESWKLVVRRPTRRGKGLLRGSPRRRCAALLPGEKRRRFDRAHCFRELESPAGRRGRLGARFPCGSARRASLPTQRALAGRAGGANAGPSSQHAKPVLLASSHPPGGASDRRDKPLKGVVMGDFAQQVQVPGHRKTIGSDFCAPFVR